MKFICKLDLMCVLVCVLAYEEEEDLEPVVVEEFRPLPLVQADDPPPAIRVPAHTHNSD